MFPPTLDTRTPCPLTLPSLFARITLGNQLDGIHLLDPDVVAQFKQRYPDGIISKPKNM